MSIKNGLIAFVASALILVYYVIDPTISNFGLPCLLKAATGWDCWGCGGQRAFHQLLHGNFRQALHLNALVFPVVLLFGYILFSELSQQQPSYQWLRRNDVRISTAIIVLSFTIFRNIV
ncbi:DUF2752 domain-containing protein [Dyadobacter sp. NIV53]|uniref:DUF2752 domain-containing protein n=1 Tax=Dyadobacter sp. NIV53 TaxID=2861765 RepID=UPI001C8756FD|nr:DUF2752 domain-containing protein [Dyadobacter sp. NIV53]